MPVKALNTLFFLAAAVTSMSAAADCRPDKIKSSTPSSQFTVEEQIVTDNHTTLIWTRCAVGQRWDGKACMGQPRTVNWSDAMALVGKLNADNHAGHHDWRLPVMPELASIVERQCFNPRMNEEVFTGAPSMKFWSSMEKMGAPEFAYTIDFGSGEAVPTSKATMGAVRLVRGGPWWQPPAMSQR